LFRRWEGLWLQFGEGVYRDNVLHRFFICPVYSSDILQPGAGRSAPPMLSKGGLALLLLPGVAGFSDRPHYL